MDITAAMLRAARSAEFVYFQQHRLPGRRFAPLPDGLMRAIVEAAIGAIGEDDVENAPAPTAVPEEEEQVPPAPERPKQPAIVTARKPKPRR
jgi:hypothetical protein